MRVFKACLVRVLFEVNHLFGFVQSLSKDGRFEIDLPIGGV